VVLHTLSSPAEGEMVSDICVKTVCAPWCNLSQPMLFPHCSQHFSGSRCWSMSAILIGKSYTIRSSVKTLPLNRDRHPRRGKADNTASVRFRKGLLPLFCLRLAVSRLMENQLSRSINCLITAASAEEAMRIAEVMRQQIGRVRAVLPEMHSIYLWKGKFERAREC